MPPNDGDCNVHPAVHPTPDAVPEPKTEDGQTVQGDNPDHPDPQQLPRHMEDNPNVHQHPLHMEDMDDPPKQPPPNTGRELVRMCPNYWTDWDVEAAPELCTECPNTELINVEWLPGSNHNRTAFGPRQVCIPVPLPLPLAVPFHNHVYVCFQRQSAKAVSDTEAEATAAKQAEEEQTVCVRLVASRPFGCSDVKFRRSVFPGARPRRRSRRS